jgi:hypothetical protein
VAGRLIRIDDPDQDPGREKAQAASEIRGKVRAAGKLEMIDGGLILTAKNIEVAKPKEPDPVKVRR